MTRQKTQNIHLLITLLLIVAGSAGFYHAYQANTELTPVLPPLAAEKNLKRWLQEDTTLLQTDRPLNHLNTIQQIYARTGYRLLWVKNYKLDKSGQQLLQQLSETSADQLYDYAYHLTYIQQKLRSLPTRPKEATSLDIRLTDAFIAYADDVLSTRLHPSSLSIYPNGLTPVAYGDMQSRATRDTDHRHNNIVDLISENVHQRTLSKVLNNMTPPHPAYQKLRQALSFYQDLSQNQAWQRLPDGPTLVAGMQHPQVPHLRKLLHLYGDYPLKRGFFSDWFNRETKLTDTEDLYFDTELEASLKQFQQRHGQKIDGKAGPVTRALLNTSPSYRIRQIALNMKRWRELPRDLGKRHIWVNMTNYQLQLFNGDNEELAMKVIIGKAQRQTPVMQESINTVVLNPHWNVPRRITLQDILPKAKRDHSYLTQRNIRIYENWISNTPVPAEQIDWAQMNRRHFPYRLRQDPGPDNALGSIKFVLPNDESIYLHDTSHPELFAKEQRALSSGCIRVEKPLVLAKALLKNSPWDDNQLQKILDAGKTRYLKVPHKIPTYLFYATAWVDEQGQLQLRDDIYDHDRPVKRTQSHIRL